MSFLYRHTPLPRDITQYIAQFTKPKIINDYKDILSGNVMHHLFNSSSPQWNIQEIVDLDIATQEDDPLLIHKIQIKITFSVTGTGSEQVITIFAGEDGIVTIE